jgi:hypothetical protein
VKTKCDRPEINEKLLLYLEKYLHEEEMEIISSHLRDCYVCSQDLKRLKEIDTALMTHKPVLSEQRAVSTCILPELLIDYAGGEKGLSVSETEKTEKHLSACAACKKEYDNLVLLREDMQKETLEKETIRGEQEFLKMVSSKYPLDKTAKRDFGRQVMETLKDAVERCKEWASDLLPQQLQPQPVLIRNGKRKFKENITVIKETSRGISVRIEIEALDEKNVELIVFLTTRKDNKPLDKVRASLFQKGKEIVSLFVEKGKVSFKGLQHGSYEISLLKKARELKRIKFKTK